MTQETDTLYSAMGEAETYAKDLEGKLAERQWQPIETAPEGEHILLYWENGERGVGGMECGTIFKTDGDWGWGYWSHGGPNSGTDWEPRGSEKPSHWMPLPAPPAAT